MKRRHSWMGLTAAVAVATAGCDPYDRYNQDPESSLGPADPFTFPSANLGAGGDRTRPGRGTFTEVGAFSDGAPLGYFSYPVPPAPTGVAVDARRVLDSGMPYARVPTPKVYAFDPAPPNPFPATSSCTPPPGYKPDLRLDEAPLNDQWSVFTALPVATYSPGVAATSTYVPVVRQAPVASSGKACQRSKSEEILVKAAGVEAATAITTDGNYLAWLIVDPASPVFPIGKTLSTHDGVGLQKFGWWNRYLLAYLDGGYIPTADEMITEGMAMKTVKRMVTQKLYYPRSMMITGALAGAANRMRIGPGAIGQGYDVLQAKRSDMDYSPLCTVHTYDVGAAAVDREALPKSEDELITRFGTTILAAPTPLVYCLQVIKPAS